jgi:hypothetical protein
VELFWRRELMHLVEHVNEPGFQFTCKSDHKIFKNHRLLLNHLVLQMCTKEIIYLYLKSLFPLWQQINLANSLETNISELLMYCKLPFAVITPFLMDEFLTGGGGGTHSGAGGGCGKKQEL